MNNWLTCESDTFWFGSVAGSRYSTILLLSIGSIKEYKIKSKIVFYKIYLQIITVYEGSTNYTYPTKIGSGFGSGSRSEEKARIRIQHTASNCWLQKNGLHLFSTKMSFFSAASSRNAEAKSQSPCQGHIQNIQGETRRITLVPDKL